MNTEAKYRAEIRAEIERLQKIEAAMDGKPATKRVTMKGNRRPMSKASRKKIAAAQKKRWKAFHEQQKKKAA